MILRRDFLKSMAFAALATVLPDIPLPVELEPEPVLDVHRQVYYYQQYSLGFQVSKEMLEDDVYGDYIPKWNSELMTRFRVQP